MDDFDQRNDMMIQAMGQDRDLHGLSTAWFQQSNRFEYSYHFTWMGRPIIQFPQDIMALQEIIWRVKPRLIVETGIARGGSLIFHASMLELLQGDGRVLGIDVEIRPHNRRAIEQHPMFKRIVMCEGSSVDPQIVQQAHEMATGRQPVLVVLDSNHTHEHVLAELQAFSPLVRRGSYVVVLDTVIEDLPAGSFPHRPWDKGNNPKTAVHEFLRTNDRFEIDERIEDKLQITVAPQGYLRCVKD